jgi:hypothetical protein
LSKELKFARDQPLKWYTVSMACLTDPDLSDERVDLTKPISLIYIIDDIFDFYGTLEELTLFTEAVNKYASLSQELIFLFYLFPYQPLLINYMLHTDGILLLLSNYPIT